MRGRGGGTGQQRYHKNHVGRMVVPGVSGFLFSVDPQSSNKAERELSLLLHPFAPPVEPAHGEKCQAQVGDAAETAVIGVAEQLRREIDAAKAQSGMPQAVHENCQKGEADSKKSERAPRPKRTDHWFTVLETNCKGYVFLNIPKPKAGDDDDDKAGDDDDDDGVDDCAEGAETPPSKKSRKEGNEEPVEGPAAVSGAPVPPPPVHERFPPNWRVSDIAEKLFEDLSRNPRPVVRYSHRFYPVLTTCYPTIACLTGVVRELGSCLQLPPNRSAIKLGLLLTIRNNSKVDAEKMQLRSALEKCLPLNKFIVLPTGRSDIKLDAVIFVFVLQSTACVGVCLDFSDRKEYNLHAVSQAALSLSDDVKRQPQAQAASTRE